ncbi:fructosamine kinase family protein [Foetidibacter luteolus]|uniref:fructosamine kinase family protein n=1 Tax=Foetidibacter luteolus TaxID=2608880 RepID=UPI00129AF330|nr:fructosamine kinase family protein [Foetidibacter luteolus]
MPQSLLAEYIVKRLNKLPGINIQSHSTHIVYGGDINQTFIIKYPQGNFFVKTNSSEYTDMFEKEARGLALLKEVADNFVPSVLLHGVHNKSIFLVLEYIAPSGRPPGDDLWKNFAVNLASLHRQTHSGFGLQQSNYIGSLPQNNNFAATWAEFFAERRLLHLTRLAVDQKRFTAGEATMMENLCKQLPGIFPEEPPALLHGDLWNGNYLVNKYGQAVIFDPAIYYGHREMDIAMTLLFGGFGTSFYHHYNEAYPLEKNWRQRIELCQLYPLLVHYLLFGGHYYQSVKTIIGKYN